MSQQLFAVNKVPLFLDSYRPGLEKRRGEDIKVLKLTLRLQPFDAKLARAVDDGVGGDSNVRATLFKLNDAEAKPHLERIQFALGCQRQNLIVFASTDTEASRILFEQAKITGTYARTEKGVNDYAFVLNATFGPVGRDQLEYIHAWHLSQRAVTFEESEPLLEVEDDGEGDDEATDADEKAREAQAPMWDDGEEKNPRTAARKPKAKPRANRRLHSHQSKKKTGRRSARA